MSTVIKLKDKSTVKIDKKEDKHDIDPKWLLKSFIPTPLKNQQAVIQKNNTTEKTSKFVAKGSKYDKLLDQCKKSGKMFVDTEFPPTNKSVVGFENPRQCQELDMPLWRQFTFKTPQEQFQYYKDNRLVTGKPYDFARNGKIYSYNIRFTYGRY